MNRKYIISFVTTSIFIIAFSVILFMIMLPQSVNLTSVDSYVDVDKEDFKFRETKNIVEDALTHQYNVTSEDIQNFKNANEYKMGNQNPFYGK